MRFLVAGNTGQLAESLVKRAAVFGAEIISTHEDSDFSVADLQDQINNTNADLFINLIGISHPDFYSEDITSNDRLELVDLVQNMAKASAASNIPIIHLSGHQVFDGKSEDGYLESTAPSAEREIGRIGIMAEDAIAQFNPNHVILRTSWLYGPDSKSFFTKMVKIAELENDLTYVARKRMGSPTSVHSLAEGIFEVAANLHSMKDNRDLRGTFHIANSGTASQLRFARYILAYCQEISQKHSDEIRNQNYESDANNIITQNAALNCDKLLFSHGVELDDWRNALRNILNESFGTVLENNNNDE